MTKELDYKDILLNSIVKDSDGDIGVVISIESIHNIEVEYKNGGSGIFCLDKNCVDYTPLFSLWYNDLDKLR